MVPWRLLAEARRRGDSDSLKVAASAISAAIELEQWEDRAMPAMVSVDIESRPGYVSISELEEDEEDFTKVFDEKYHDERRQRAWRDGQEYISWHNKKGAVLYSVSFQADDVFPLARCCPEEIEKWLEGCAQVTADFRARVSLASGFFVALCEVLLEVDPERGAVLWRSLESLLPIKLVGIAGIDEMEHVLFRVRDSTPVRALRDELFCLRRRHDEKGYFELAIAVLAGSSEEWLYSKIEADEASGTVWRLKRSAMLRGMVERPEVGQLEWPEGQSMSSLDSVQRTAVVRRNMHSLAHYWWTSFLSAKSAEEAYSAWAVFVSCADRRCWAWLSELTDSYRGENEPRLWRLKQCQFEANRRDLERMTKGREQKTIDKMEGHLWGWDAPSEYLDMSMLDK